jgi:hypothetical protein
MENIMDLDPMANMMEEEKMAKIMENEWVSLMEKINSLTERPLHLPSNSRKITTFLISLTLSIRENSIILTSTIIMKLETM